MARVIVVLSFQLYARIYRFNSSMAIHRYNACRMHSQRRMHYLPKFSIYLVP